jgi:hypothetical protein
MKAIDIEKLQDTDGHWYWIPLDMVNDFEDTVNFLSGKYYIDFPDEFDEFEKKYEKYRTYGSPDLRPQIFEQ